MPFDHTVSPTPGGDFNFNPQFPAPADSGPGDIGKKSKSIPEEKIDPRLIDLLDFIPRIQHSEDMVQFAKPFSDRLNWIRNHVFRLKDLPRFDKTPRRYLSLLAGNCGSELIDMPFADEMERRRIIKEIVPILRRRGTLWSVRRIIELLGFMVNFEELYQVTGIFNVHRFWDSSQVAESEVSYNWNDGTMQGWTNEVGGEFTPLAQKFRGTAKTGASDDPCKSATYGDTVEEYLLSVDYEIVNSGNCEFGAILRWEDWNHALLAMMYKSGATEQLGIVRYWNGSWFTITTVNISSTNWLTGKHTLRIWETANKLTVILDDTTLLYDYDYFALSAPIDPVKKGLYVELGTTIDFDDFSLKAIDRKKQPKFFSPGILDKTLKITLTGTPTHSDAKKEYLQKIIPSFVPIDTTVQWA